MSEGHIARHRNYGLLMKRHHRDLRIRRLTIVLIYILIIISIAMLFLVVRKEELQRKMKDREKETESAFCVQRDAKCFAILMS